MIHHGADVTKDGPRSFQKKKKGGEKKFSSHFVKTTRLDLYLRAKGGGEFVEIFSG